MLAITLNPGFVLIIGALLLLATPAVLRFALTLLVGATALWLMLYHDFGAADAVRQIGLPVVLLRLDEINQVFGIGFIGAAILVSVYASARRHHYEDAAILMLAGGAVSALFVGDLVSFVAAASLAGLAAVWVVLASPQHGAGAAGVRLLVWHGLEGLLLLVGVAFHISTGAANSVFERLDVRTIGGAFILAGLMIRVGAPLAHVWLKDAVSHASPAGGVALAMFSTMLGVYALARLFPGEPLLMPIGAAMIVLGAFFASAADDLRSAAAYALTAQTGVCVALIGVATQLSLAGVGAHAFTAMFAFMLLLMALGMVVTRLGEARLSRMRGLARTMPLTTAFLFTGGLAVAGAPMLAPYVSLSVALEATAHWETRWLWLLISALSALLAASLALRPALACFQPETRSAAHEAPFPMLLGGALALFFCLSVGLTPGWLYRLTPATGLNFEPYALDRVAPQLELLGAAGAAYLLFHLVGLAPRQESFKLLDLDALYRGPIAGAGRWTGVVMLRLYGAARDIWEALSARAGKVFAQWARACDRPYADRWAGAAQLGAIGLVLVLILLARH